MSKPIALQLYSMRHVEMSLDELLGEVAAIGYAGVETIGDHGLSIDEMNALLEKHNLRAISTHVSLDALEADLDGIIAFNKGIGNDTITIPYLAEELRGETGEAWSAIGKRMDVLAQGCADAGMRLLYHNHSFEMVEIEGKLAIDWLLEGSESGNLGFEPDLAWIENGGVSGVELLGRYTGRCPRIHCKDLAPKGENQDQMGLADVGHGTLDWSALLPAAKSAGG
ncbi:MAG: sugar phosphate isomerase/epimerase, partial [Chloroflexota bacterium]